MINTGDMERSLAERAIQFIEREIRAGRYLPGQRLVEANVAADSGIGIAPVREALRFLAGEGMLEILPYRGATIKRINRGEIVLILQTIVGIGTVGIRLATRNGLPKSELLALRQILRKMETAAATGGLVDVILAAEDYHVRLQDATGNPYLTLCTRRLQLPIAFRELASTITVPKWDVYWPNVHNRLHASVQARDEKGAVRIFEKHMERVIKLVSERDNRSVGARLAR